MTYEDRDRVVAWLDAGGGSELPISHRVVLVELAAHMNAKSRQAYPGQDLLARRWGVKGKTIANIETELIRKGLIRRARWNHYVILWDALSTETDKTSRQRESKESTEADKISRKRETDSRERELDSRQREHISESSRTRREVRDDDSPPSDPADPSGTAGSTERDAGGESRLPAWVELVLSRRPGWTVADAAAYCEERVARARGGKVAAARRVKFIGTCLDNDGPAGTAGKPKPPPKPVKAKCANCDRHKALDVLVWYCPPDEESPSAVGYGLCGECIAEMDEDERAELHAAMTEQAAFPPCGCGQRFRRQPGYHGVTTCPACWRIGDPYPADKDDAQPSTVDGCVSGPAENRPAEDPPPDPLGPERGAGGAGGAVVAVSTPERVAVSSPHHQAVHGGKCPSCDSPAVVLVNGYGFWCDVHSR